MSDPRSYDMQNRDPQTMDTRVAILASPAAAQHQLSRQLSAAGLQVVATHVPGEDFLNNLAQTTPNVVLIDLGDDIDTEIPVITRLLDANTIPMLFNDSAHDVVRHDAEWAEKLARKLTQTAHPPRPEPVYFYNRHNPVQRDPTPVSEHNTAPEEPVEQPARQVWILGASLGGPEAIREFLAAIKPDLPVCFLLIQQIHTQRLATLIQQWQAVCAFTLLIAEPDHLLQHQQVIVIPADKTVYVNEQGRLQVISRDPNVVYAPDIDEIINHLVARYHRHVNLILFSGLGGNGVKGGKQIAEQGGTVWAQAADSCVVSHLPDQARLSNSVSYSGDPGDMARQLNQTFNTRATGH